MALAVVAEHSFGMMFSGGVFAVQLFFVISGFYISYILIEAQSYHSVRTFYENRFLRLYPLYWIVALGSLTMYGGAALLTGNPPAFIEVYQQTDTTGFIALALSNVLLIGQDWIIFTAINDGVFHLTADYYQSDIFTWRGLLVPPAWSLGVEITFYLIAPFILPRLRLLFVLLGLSIALRLWLISIGIGLDDPWNYRFFPTELALFILGALSHQLVMPWLRARNLLTAKAALTISLTMIVLVLVGVTLSLFHAKMSVLVLFVLSLPFLFTFQRDKEWDRWLGDLSFPIYIVHWSVMFPVSYAWDRMTGQAGYQGLDETAVIVVLTIVAALGLKRWVTDPIESIRDAVRQNGRRNVLPLRD